MVDLSLPLARAKAHPWLNPWALITLLLVGVCLGPIAAVFVTATGDSGGLWAHLFETVLPRYVTNTVVLASGVAVVSLVFGVTSAWVVVRYDFPGRRIFEWMLLLPAAVPAYLIAYSYTDFFEYAGPVQGALRDLFGWQSAADYWFPEIRSMGGAMLVMGAVLYPYVYAMSRAAFLLTPASLFEVGMLAQRNLFWSIALPLARPAIVAGLALVLMETVSDFGTVEYFAIETLTLGIFNVWLGMNSLTAASQIAVFAVVFIVALLILEKIARARRRFTDTTRRSVSLHRLSVKGWAAVPYWAVCVAPILTGFLLPVGVLLSFVLRGHSLGFDETMLSATVNSLFLAATAAALVMAAAAFMGLVAAYQGGPTLRRLTALASIGYAFPGTILAIGVVTAGGALDDGMDTVLRNAFGLSYQGWLTSGVGLIILGCIVRFQAIGYGAVTSGLERLPANMMEASRVLGQDYGDSMRRVILPLIRLSFVAGGLLVFVDVMKELPMTLLLRPFNFESLATYVYQFAKDELLEEAALPALIIIATGIIPVMMMNAALGRFTRH
jgi:iron(III) transport system permease protein